MMTTRADFTHHYGRVLRALAEVRRSLAVQHSAEAQAAGCRNALFALDAGGEVPSEADVSAAHEPPHPAQATKTTYTTSTEK